MGDPSKQAKTIFLAALEKHEPEEWPAFLEQACAGDVRLRAEVEKLLRAQSELGSFHEASGGGTIAQTPDDAEDDASLEFLSPSKTPGSLGRLGHYEILELIGRGGMGIVLRGFDDKLHRVVAIKVMAAQLATNATARKRFLREARTQAAISHDHIVTIHEVDEADGLPYLVMQYVAGVSLQQRLDKSGPMQVHEILRIGMQTASGLAASHAQGLIHRDIKPANILLENGVERVKITDFGLARAASDANLTGTGNVAGTPQYMSPEQAQGAAVDQRSDLFSLGSVLYAMSTGHAPFHANSTVAVLKRVCEETPRPIQEINEAIPDWLVALIAKLHAKDPANRYQSAAEVAAVIGDCLARVQQPRSAPTAALPIVSPQSRGRRWVAVAAALLVAVGCLGFTVAAAITGLTGFFAKDLTSRPEGAIEIAKNGPASKSGAEIKQTGDASAPLKLLTPSDSKNAPNAKPDRDNNESGSTSAPPKLLTPVNGALLGNGARDRSKVRAWDFTWAPVARARKYHIHVTLSTATSVLIDDPNVTLPSYHHESSYWVIDQFRRDWRWKVRAMVVDGTWTDWSEERTFDVESLAPVEARFVIMGRDGNPERKHLALDTAIGTAVGGDVIEIHGNGPYFCTPIEVKGALTIRAGSGFHPVLVFGPDVKLNTKLLTTSHPLVLEGLDLQMGKVDRAGGGKAVSHPILVSSSRAPLHVANCRFVAAGYAINFMGSPTIEFRNCQLITYSPTFTFGPDCVGQHLLDNNVIACSFSGIGFFATLGHRNRVSVRFTRNTLVSPRETLKLFVTLPLPEKSVDEPLYHVESSDNIIDGKQVFENVQYPGKLPEEKQLTPVEAEDLLLRLIRWREERNLYPTDVPFLGLKNYQQGTAKPVSPTRGVSSLAEWNKFWSLKDTGSVNGSIRYQGGDVLQKFKAWLQSGAPSTLGELNPEAFRLRADSAGHRAGKDGRDIGADVDLVGPGAAYERWKKSPAYQEWLKHTGQVK